MMQSNNDINDPKIQESINQLRNYIDIPELINIPYILNKTNLFNIVHYLKLYDSLIDDIKIIKDEYDISIIVNNTEVILDITGISYNTNSVYHNPYGPACIQWDEDGIIRMEIYMIDGKLHRTDGPAIIEYYETGMKRFEAYIINRIDDIHVKDMCIIEYYENGMIKVERDDLSEDEFNNFMGDLSEYTFYLER